MARFGYGACDLIALISSAGNYDFYAVSPSGTLQRYARQQFSDILAVAGRHRCRLDSSWVEAT